jgi:cell division protein FtsW (lipid II flippase)
VIKNNKPDFILGLLIIVLALIGSFVFIPRGVVLPDNIETRALSPDFWPLIIMMLLGIAGIALTIQSKYGKAANDREADSVMRPLGEGLIRVAIVIAWLLGMFFAIPFIGMPIACALTFAAMSLFAGERRWKYILPITILMPLALYLFFVYVANVPLPVGVFEAWK